MLQNYIFLLLTTFLLTQYGLFTTALPASTTAEESKVQSEDYATNEELEAELSARNKLLMFTLDEFTFLSNFSVEQGIKIFRNILNDASMSTKNSELQAHCTRLSNFVEKVEQLKEKSEQQTHEKLYDIVIEFTDIVESFNNTETKKNVAAEDLHLQNLLRKHGLEQMELDFLAHFEVFSQKFYKEAEKYFLALSEKEKLSEAEMIAWYEKFKNESEGDKKIELFAKFFDFYKDK